VPRARIVECDRAKAISAAKQTQKTPQIEAAGHVRPGLHGHFIVEDEDEDEDEEACENPVACHRVTNNRAGSDSS
jgi:hypothetical protein